jgi:hypothetical protein
MSFKYEINKCEDTGKPAIYEVTTHGGGPARILIAHEVDFWEMYSTLAKYHEAKAKGSNDV